MSIVTPAHQVETIKKRYIHERAIYTWCGIALVAVNPYQEQDIYGEQVVETYHSASHSAYLQLDPHIYAVTEDAYTKLDLHSKDQSIIVSGESGAGKTVSAKHAMRYLASIAGSSRASKLRIENRVLASNPIMEAIGNASTVRNDNSSRFGKYIQIYFDRHRRRILGASMRTYLLEKSRVTSQQPGERNFHIFYQLLNYSHKNPKKMAHLQLVDPEDSNRMRRFDFLAGIEPQESRDDLRRFNEALKTLNIDEQRVDLVYRVIAGILHGGNIRFKTVVLEGAEEVDEDTPCTVDMDDLHFRACCQLIGLDPEETRKRLTIKLLRSGRDVIEKPQSRRKAEYARDAMLKYIYECLFNWLVALINLSLSSKTAEQAESDLQTGAGCTPMATPLKSPTAKKSLLADLQPQFIGVLDIYGFENFKTNSFEQFCINYANEVLQQQYNQHVFKIEQEEYIREGIDWTFIEYSDNQPVIDIIESRPIGILNLLDEECKMPKGSDKSWCAKLYDQLLPSSKSQRERARFQRPKLNYQNSFTICHYAEDVNYQVTSFLEKNRDTIGEEQCELLRSSEVLSYVFEDPAIQVSLRPKMRTARSATVGSQFRGSLAALIRTLNATEPHYIRCIKPNDEKKAFEFNEERAHQQLRACGVYETIRISNNGFPSRWHYKDFARRYCVLIYGTKVFGELALMSQRRREQQSAQAAAAAALEAAANQERERDDASGSSPGSLSPSEELNNQTANSKQAAPVEPTPASRHFMRQFSSADVRPICEAICKLVYEEESMYAHLRTDEERNYIDHLKERHGNKSCAIYQFGKTKIFFRAGQVGFLERVRSQRLREYSMTIQRHVRGWLARRSFRVRREEYLEQMRREASLVSLQNQVNSLQTELEQVREEREAEQQASATVSRLGSMYQLVVDIVYRSIQPLIIGAVLEYEALDPPAEPFLSLDSSSRSTTLNGDEDDDTGSESSFDPKKNKSKKLSMEYLIKELNGLHDLISKNQVPEDIAIQLFKQIFYLICAHSLNQLLIRRDLCQFRKAMQINFNLSCLVQWCREHYLVRWREIVEQLDPITQATKLLQTRKSSEDIATIEEVCNKLRPSQIVKILNMYTSTYEEQITIDFIHELEEYLNITRANALRTDQIDGQQPGELNNKSEISIETTHDSGFDLNNNGNFNNNDLLMDTKHYFAFVDVES